MKKALRFKTNTLLKNLVGKDLINDDNIAIVELVKGITLAFLSHPYRKVNYEDLYHALNGYPASSHAQAFSQLRARVSSAAYCFLERV